MSNKIFIATSMDGYIADRDGGLGFLETVPNPDGADHGYGSFVDSIDALVMGRKTLETVLGFGIPWPYQKPVFVLSSTMKSVPDELSGKVEIVSGPLKDVVKKISDQGFNDLYIDGGKVIQGFLAEDMIEDLIVTVFPVLLGGGTQLFGSLPKHLDFSLVKSTVLQQALIQSHYRRVR